MNEKPYYPKGWDEAKVRAVAEHYDNLTEDELEDEIEAALDDDNFVLISVPRELADEVRALLARHQAAA
jgi:hypothetical protein